MFIVNLRRSIEVLLLLARTGALIDLVSGLLGTGIGYAVLTEFPTQEAFQPGNLPIDIEQGAYLQMANSGFR